MKQKKILAMLTAVMLLVSSLGLTAFAEGTGASDTVSVYVTISDGEGKLALAQEKIEVTDRDGNGNFTIDEALYAAHEAKYEGGATAGYTQSGGWLTKLWGIESSNWGIVLNNVMSNGGLYDTIQENSYINVYLYRDTSAWSDAYSFFDTNFVTVDQNKSITLTLNHLEYDTEEGATVKKATKDATITLNGNKTDYKTDAEGKVTVKLTEVGKCVISAVSDSQTLVPPVCVATVKAAAVPDNTGNVSDAKADSTPKTGDAVNTVVYGVMMIAAFATVIVVMGREKKYYEK